MTDVSREDAAVDTRVLDSAYKPLPPFALWSQATVDLGRWNRYANILSERGKVSRDVLDRAHRIVTRAAAIDTGAIEGLYDVDRGFTFTVATEAAVWEAAVDAKGSNVRQFFEAQLGAYEYVLDLATQREPITEAIIRTLHLELCGPQETYSVATAIGIQEQPLQKGEYKTSPNHVRARDGAMHSYAPVDLTPAEMHRLVDELRSDAFVNAHPVLQASYAHYGLVMIHPFADGNGRVARALASIFTYRAQSVPFLILYDHRGTYYDALTSADRGLHQVFVDFTLARILDAMRLVDESIRAALVPDPAAAAASVQRLYVTKAGFTHAEVDVAGNALLHAAAAELTRVAPEYQRGPVSISVSRAAGALKSPAADFRHPISGPGHLEVAFGAPPPADVSFVRKYQIEVPRDCGADDDLTLRNPETGDTFTARIEEVNPASAVLNMRLNIFARRVISQGLLELKHRAETAMRSKGY